MSKGVSLTVDETNNSQDSQVEIDELRRSIRKGPPTDRKASKPGERARRVNWRKVTKWLIVLALVLDIAAMLSYILDQRFFRSMAADIIAGDYLTDQEILERFVDFAQNDLRRPSYDELPTLIKLYYKYNPFHPSARDAVKYGCDYRGGCGSSSSVVLALLGGAGLRSRSLILCDERGRRVHAVVNAEIDGRWAVADPLYGIVFTRSDSTLATAEELRDDRGLFLENARRHPSYPAGVFNYDNFALMNWKKVPVVLPAVRWALSRIIGEERTASISRPKLWMYPFPAFAVAFTAFTVVLAGAVRLRRSKNRRRAV